MITGMDPQYWSDIVKELGDSCKSITSIIGLGCLIGKGIMSVLKKESGDVNEGKNPMYVLS